jgi:transposase
MGEYMMKPRTYTPELRDEAVKLVLAQGLTLGEAAKRIAIPMGTLAHWAWASCIAVQ